MFRQTAETLLNSNAPAAQAEPMAQSVVQLVEIYYDFTCQDLPPDLEDSHEEFFGANGWWIKFLAWDPEALRGDVSCDSWIVEYWLTKIGIQPDESTPTVVARIKTAILEILEVRYVAHLVFAFADRNGVYHAVLHQDVPRAAHEIRRDSCVCAGRVVLAWVGWTSRRGQRRGTFVLLFGDAHLLIHIVNLLVGLPSPAIPINGYQVRLLQRPLRVKRDDRKSRRGCRSPQHRAPRSVPLPPPPITHPSLLTPSPTEHELEQFEDDPLEYIRRDISFSSTSSSFNSSTDTATRRQGAANVVQSLAQSGFEAETTEVVGGWIQKGLNAYKGDRGEWKAKDSAVFLFGAVAVKGMTMQVGLLPFVYGAVWSYLRRN